MERILNELVTLEQYQYHEQYLLILKQALKQQFEINRRITCIRFDLRFPKHMHYQDPQCISRFFDSFKAKLRVWDNHRLGSHPLNMSYVWVREQNDSQNWHYHAVIFMNKDACVHIGCLDLNRSNMFSRIVEAWASAIGIADIECKPLVEVPLNAVTHLNVNTAEFAFELQDFWLRYNYLAKSRTKDIYDGYRNIGYSQKVFN
ncbi:inovirus Gp2 family protein [Shewanella baltica]|uniref:inovirus Gp2 family protein n=1 Tax=Shewanella baltica TaxID=62322 RepID=UPI00217D6861|nr:inovirus Gp2 family protein [Shewanella baltica]MCS6178910.1 inovirus Gp2 family protein [Shewanella baltica]MCS6255074.1 inovirus Gp2 family protein [Shewanella baltica]